jgi:hypothetical protein
MLGARLRLSLEALLSIVGLVFWGFVSNFFLMGLGVQA